MKRASRGPPPTASHTQTSADTGAPSNPSSAKSTPEGPPAAKRRAHRARIDEMESENSEPVRNLDSELMPPPKAYAKSADPALNPLAINARQSSKAWNLFNS